MLLGSAYGKVRLDSSGVRKGVSDAKSAYDDLVTKARKIGGQLKQAGTVMTVALTIPLVMAGWKTIQYASDLNETKSKVGVIFGQMSEEVLAWSENSATAMGQSQQQALDAASNMAIFGQAAGLADKDLVKFAESNTLLASDLASFFNTSPEEAITAIGAAYRGEAEPIRKYGVLLNQASIEQKAVELGLIKQGDELTQQARILAVNALIMDQTTQAQGDFARTSDGLANQQRIMTAELKDTATAIGQMLLPYALKAVQLFRDLLTRFRNLSPEMQRIILIVLGIVAVIGPLLTVIGGVISGITAVAGVIGVVSAPVLAVIAIIIAVIALLYLAWKNNFGGIQEKTAAFVASVKMYWENVLLPAIMKVWGWMQSTLFPFLAALANFLGAVLGLAVRALAGLWQNVLYPAIQKVMAWMQANVIPKLQPIADFIRNKLASAFQWLSDKIKKVTDWLNDMATKLENMELPDWMTPGSPTPWEIGLVGVARAMRQVSKNELPAMQAGLLMPAPAFANGNSSVVHNRYSYSFLGTTNFGSPGDLKKDNWIRARVRG